MAVLVLDIGGVVYRSWPDDVLHELESATPKSILQLEADADQIVFSRDNPEYPRLTHYILSCRKSGIT